MRVLLVAEGKHERGTEDRDGALETLVRRLHPDVAYCDLDRVSRKDIHAHHGRGQGYFKKALRWMLEAEKRGYDALILLIDQDNTPQRVHEITNAQHDPRVPLRRALGAAIRTFEAWMLADEQALTRILGKVVLRQPSPEDISNAKGVCAQLLDSYQAMMSQSIFYASIAQEADLEAIAQRCPRGFAPFAQRLRTM